MNTVVWGGEMAPWSGALAVEAWDPEGGLLNLWKRGRS